MEIKNGAICIRPATVEDAKILCKWWNDKEIMGYAGYPNGWNITEKEIADKIVNGPGSPAGRWIIEIDNKPCGEMIYENKENNVAAIGVKMCDLTLKENGYGTKALKMFMKYLLETVTD